MKKFFILAIIILTMVIGVLIAKEKGLFQKLSEIIKEKSETSSKEKEKKETKIEKAIVDMDGFVVPVVKNGNVIASLELSFKVLVNVKIKSSLEVTRSVLRARMTSIIYDYIDKHYEAEMNLEKLKTHMVTELQKIYGETGILDVLFAFYYIRPAA